MSLLLLWDTVLNGNWFVLLVSVIYWLWVSTYQAPQALVVLDPPLEHYLLHCERYFNEREALRTHIFNTTGTPYLSCEFLLSCTKTDFRKIHEMNIFSALGDFITRTARFLCAPPVKFLYRETIYSRRYM